MTYYDPRSMEALAALLNLWLIKALVVIEALAALSDLRLVEALAKLI